MELLFFITLIAAWYHLGSRLTKLEDRISQLETMRSTAVPISPIPVPGSHSRTNFQSTDMTTAFQEVDQRQAAAAPRASAFIDWLTNDLMVKLGALLLILAIGWFVSLTIREGWIGPSGQIALSLLLGVTFLILGIWRIEKFRHQGGIFTVLGATIVLLTLLAARGIYDFFTPLSALFVMFLAIAFVGFVSVRYRSERLAFAGLILAYLAPFFTAAMPIPAVELFTYLLIVTVGILWTVWMTGWTKLTLTSLVFLYFYSVGYLTGAPEMYRDTTLMYSFLFVAIYFAANMVSLVRRHGEGKMHMATHTLTALGTAIFLLTWIESAVAPEWKSLLYTAWALVFAVGTYIIYFYTANQSAFYLYAATSATLIGVATAAELDGPVLTLAYLLEIGLVILASGKVGMANQILARMSWLFAVPILLSSESFNPRFWREGILAEHFTVVFGTMVMITLIGWYIRERNQAEGSIPVSTITANALLLIGASYAVLLVWLVTHAWFSYDLATLLSLVIYTVVGIALLVLGANRNSSTVKIVGGVLIGLVIVRLLLIEVWNMELEGRIATFLIVGFLLISTAFMRKNQYRDNSLVE